MARYRWIARFGYRVGCSSVRFRGREPFSVPEKYEKEFLETGVFAKNPDGKLFYSFPVGLRLESGGKTPVGLDGIVELDADNLHGELKSNSVLNELADPEEAVPPPVFTAGYDDTPPESLCKT